VNSRAADTSQVGSALVMAGPNTVESDARLVAAAYETPEVLTGPKATRSRFFRDAANRAIIHIQADTYNNGAYPLLSRVLLNDEPGARHSGALLGRDIATAQFPAARLVVIDETRTRGSSDRDSNSIGTTRAFMAAGVPAVLSTLPGADEAAMRELFVGFHRAVASGATAVDALTRLQRNALQQNGRRLGAWTALVLYGSDR
jgi:CHAT domain-containing protein